MTEIKISDLSVGDWIATESAQLEIKGDDIATAFVDKVKKPIQIVSVLGAEQLVFGRIEELDGFTTIYLKAEHIEPIPLTPEILEKNGFDAPKAKVWNDSWYWSNRKDVALELRESFGLWYMEIVTKEQRSGLQSNRKLGIGFKYVHQLQHALRLAGVGKEIVL